MDKDWMDIPKLCDPEKIRVSCKKVTLEIANDKLMRRYACSKCVADMEIRRTKIGFYDA